MVTGIERGNTDDTFTWDGKLVVTGTSTLTGDVTVTGALAVGGVATKKSVISFTATGAGTAQDSGFTIPAGSLVLGTVVVLTAAANEATKYIYYGANSASAPTDFMNGLPVSTGTSLGAYTGQPTIAAGTNIGQVISGNYVGSALCTYAAGVDSGTAALCTTGYYVEKPAYYATATKVYYKLTTGTTLAAGKIIIIYV